MCRSRIYLVLILFLCFFAEELKVTNNTNPTTAMTINAKYIVLKTNRKCCSPCRFELFEQIIRRDLGGCKNLTGSLPPALQDGAKNVTLQYTWDDSGLDDPM
jgi:hypothetical protein